MNENPLENERTEPIDPTEARQPVCDPEHEHESEPEPEPEPGPESEPEHEPEHEPVDIADDNQADSTDTPATAPAHKKTEETFGDCPVNRREYTLWELIRHRDYDTIRPDAPDADSQVLAKPRPDVWNR